MELRKNDSGFTFLNMFFTLAIIAASLPFLSHLVTYSQPNDHLDELSVQQFFRFVRNDLINSVDYALTSDSLYLTLVDGTVATIETYQDSIRRRVEGKGHELYLRNMETLEFSEAEQGISVTVRSLEGNTYEKILVFYE
ncbi:competence type IV pilus minor pilin ComGF [Virgibacillus sediminis]|uniref:Competence type IV pilus minor pilin ComGF n=1 Tax=Virgibacillus sediminis TaxID=202260 RepID=A0ABV7A5K7_9BACI